MLARLEESIDRYLAARHNRARQVTSATNSPAGYKSRRWLEVMREDSRAIVRAASQASKAADWLLAHLPDAGTDVERQTPTEGRTAA